MCSLLDSMRKERYVYEAIYMKFANSVALHHSYAFCFYEGEDGKYYDNRIRNYFDEMFLTYKVQNKDGVLKLLTKIRSSNLYENVCTMFFVDRDYDNSLSGSDVDLFETPCYSIENLYAQKECMERVLKSEMGLNVDNPDFHKCITDYTKREIEFNKVILEFNALVYLRRKRPGSNSDFSFGSVKTTHIASINVMQVAPSSQYQDTINQIKGILHFSEEEVLKAKEKLIESGDQSITFRGKNQLDFFAAFINCIKQYNNDNNGYFKIKYKNVTINITNNRLSELSQYAITPPELSAFLERHKLSFERTKTEKGIESRE